MFDFIPSFLLTTVTFAPKVNEYFKFRTAFLCVGPLNFCNERVFFYLFHSKAHWIMTLDNVGLKVSLLGPRVPWLLLQWSMDDFNNRSHILEGQGTTS